MSKELKFKDQCINSNILNYNYEESELNYNYEELELNYNYEESELNYNYKESELYKTICKQKEKNTRFGNYNESTHATKFFKFLKKKKKLNRKILYKLKKTFCFCFKENLKIDLDDSYFDEYSFYDDTDIFEIENIKNYIFLFKKLIKIFLKFLFYSKKHEIYSELDLLRFFLNEKVKMCSVLKTNLVTKYQNNSSKNIKNFRGIDIIPIVTSLIILPEFLESFLNNENNENNEYYLNL